MTTSTPKPSTLSAWLEYIEALHPKSIAMGLDRVLEVVKRLKLTLDFPIITIAGTNGKGSTSAMLEAIYLQSGKRVGCYTSPHLLCYNERVRINRQLVDDATLCDAFTAVETARENIALTYFEMGTLAAMWHFSRLKLDIAVLEIGMGGRLDAVNAFEPDCAIVTSVDLDHMEFLGDTREKIGFEKAGVFRAGKPAICGDDHPPKNLLEYAREINADLRLIQRDFTVKKLPQGWQYSDAETNLQLSEMPLHGDFQMNNAACAIHAALQLRHMLPLNNIDIQNALAKVSLVGRFQQVRSNPTIVLDVAHNPQAARSLAHNLQTTSCDGRTLGVFAMLADKDIDGVIRELQPHISTWYLADIHNSRGANAKVLKGKLSANANSECFDSVAEALDVACKDAGRNDRIVVFGSFYTVAEAIASLNIEA